MIILGIETSCDETSAAVVKNGRDVLSNIVHTQLQHRPFGGVVPEIASRCHIQLLPDIIRQAVTSANIDWWAGHVENEVGKNFGRLLQLYGVHKAQIEARRKGLSTQRRTLADGSVKLVIGGVA